MTLVRLVTGFLVAAIGTGIVAAVDPQELPALAYPFAFAVLCGLIAGSWWAVVAAPVAVWTGIWAIDATDCPDCGGGGEPLPAAAQAIAVVLATVVFAALGALGAGASKLARRHKPRRFIRTDTASARLVMVAGPAVLAVVGLGLLAARERSMEARNGPVLFEQGDKRYRAGPEWDGDGRRGSLSQAEIEDFDRFPLYWLGPSFEGYNLVTVQDSGWGVYFIYGDCGPAPCSPPVSVLVQDACGFPLQPAGAAGNLRALPGGAVSAAPGEGTMVWTGRAALQVRALTGEQVTSALAALQPVPGGRPPGPPAPDPCAA